MPTNQHDYKVYPINNDNSKLTLSRLSYRPFVTSFDEIYAHPYQGEGTLESPFIVDWLPNDSENPQAWNHFYKWTLAIFVVITFVTVVFCSSAFIGESKDLSKEFNSSQEVNILGISLFVLGFSLGPLLWAPFSEMIGRRILFIITYLALTVFNAAAVGSQNIWTIIILRFLAGAFGSSPLANASGTIADIFSAQERGPAVVLVAAMPFFGATLGPIVGSFSGAALGWRWVQCILAIFTCVLTIIGAVAFPETYTPVLLRWRAEKLSEVTGRVYQSKFQEKEKINFCQLLKTSVSRPWIFLFREPIVLLFSIYVGLVNGVLYMFIAAFPIVYGELRGWSRGVVSLAFLGIVLGVIFAILFGIWDNRRYIRIAKNDVSVPVPPETRLSPAMVGSFALPIGLFWFAWTNYPSVHFMVSISACVPVGFGMALIYVSSFNYLVDSYIIYAASALAANSVLRSSCAALFPLFTATMFHNLGIHWAASIPAFLALICLPMPFILWKYGPVIRRASKYSSRVINFMDQISRSRLEKLEKEPETKLAMDTTIKIEPIETIYL